MLSWIKVGSLRSSLSLVREYLLFANWLAFMILFGQMGILGLIYYLRKESLYPSAWSFMTHQKLKDVLRPTFDKITSIGLVSIWEYEETIFFKTNRRLDELNEIMYGEVVCMLLSIQPVSYWRCFGSLIIISGLWQTFKSLLSATLYLARQTTYPLWAFFVGILKKKKKNPTSLCYLPVPGTVPGIEKALNIYAR